MRQDYLNRTERRWVKFWSYCILKFNGACHEVRYLRRDTTYFTTQLASQQGSITLFHFHGGSWDQN